ncbi:hypothetical protein BC826DRAFT_973987 [Russula brevipes]|nr:hypothetical protein BC826DRAFT_973987 [Russula brevipes]
MSVFVIPDAPPEFQINPTRRWARGNAVAQEDPGTSTCVGSISHDREKKRFTVEWEDLDDFQAWLKAKQLDNSIEFISHHTTRSEGPIWQEREGAASTAPRAPHCKGPDEHRSPRGALCTSTPDMGTCEGSNARARQGLVPCLTHITVGTGLGPVRPRAIYASVSGTTQGDSSSQPKPGANRKIERKFTNCKCKITVKLYWHVPTVLGHYETEHNHEIHDENLQYMRLSMETRALVLDLLRLRVNPKEIVCHYYYIFNSFYRLLSVSGSASNRSAHPPIAIIISQFVISVEFN